MEIETRGMLWKTSPRMLRASARNVNRWLDSTIRDFTKVIATRLRRGIRHESGGIAFRLRKLSPRYVRRKRLMGQPRFPLIASAAYAGSIVVKKLGSKDYSVTTARGQHPHAKLSYAELASYLENGTRRMDPLPHWKPAMRHAKRYARKVFGRMPRGLIRLR